ncbi:MAG: hypothetical protein STSR0004_10650 [Peptococcaceae bacterium]
MEFNTTILAQIIHFVILLSFTFLFIFVPVLMLFRLSKRVKNIEDIVTNLQRQSEKSGDAENHGKGK